MFPPSSHAPGARVTQLIEDSREFFAQISARFERPVLLFSGGIDSVAMVWLSLLHGWRWPAIMFSEPAYPAKFAYARNVIAMWGLTVYDWAPAASGMWIGKSIPAFVRAYRTGPNTTLTLLKTIVPATERDPLRCGLAEIMQRPHGEHFAVPWDVMVCGHREDDEDCIAGKIPLACDVHQPPEGGPAIAFPMRRFTADDVWFLTKHYGLPLDIARYDAASPVRKERPDEFANSDSYALCVLCMDRREKGESVHCPLLNKDVRNRSAEIPYHDGWLPEYILKEV